MEIISEGPVRLHLSQIRKIAQFRIQGATTYLGYSKMLRMASPSDAALGQLITFCTGDSERIHEAVVSGILFVGTPMLFLLAAVYACHLVGPIALLGLLIILLFYPIAVSAAITCRAA